jgi:hypothetical protein
MGRHVNYADEQDRWLNKADKINRNAKRHQRLEDRDPATLTLAEQFELEKRMVAEIKKKKELEANTPKKKVTYYSHHRPK